MIAIIIYLILIKSVCHHHLPRHSKQFLAYLGSDGMMRLHLEQPLEPASLLIAQVAPVRLHEPQQRLMPHHGHLRHEAGLLQGFLEPAEKVKKHVECDRRKCITLAEEHFDKEACADVVVELSQFQEGGRSVEGGDRDFLEDGAHYQSLAGSGFVLG